MTSAARSRPDLDIRAWSGDRHELRAAAELYTRVFAEPPYNESPEASRASFLDRVARYSNAKPHFRLLLAWNEGNVIGLALGSGAATGDWWRDRIVDQLPPACVDNWFGAEAFAVVELATAASHRRSGVAAALLRALVTDLPYSTAVLTAYSEVDIAKRFYSGQGWTQIATGLRIGESPELCVFGLHLSEVAQE